MNPPIEAVVARIAETPGCVLLPPDGLPNVAPWHRIPDDVRRFYTLCGGATLFAEGGAPLVVVTPRAFVSANPVVMPEVDFASPEVAHFADDASWAWYHLADAGNGNHVVIDCAADGSGNGRCIDANHETYPAAGQTPVIALTLVELLWRRQTTGSPDAHYWEGDFDFRPHGDAYDPTAP